MRRWSPGLLECGILVCLVMCGQLMIDGSIYISIRTLVGDKTCCDRLSRLKLCQRFIVRLSMRTTVRTKGSCAN